MPEDDEVNRFLCMAVDVESYSARGIWGQADLQALLRSTLEGASTDARLDRLTWLAQEQGDGELALIPPGPAERYVVGELVRYLDARLGRINSDRRHSARVRLRVAFDHGWARREAMGYAGAAVIGVNRLLAAAELKRALAHTDRANLAVIMSPTVFDTVRQGLTLLPHEEFYELFVQVKEYSEQAWIWVPGANPVPPPVQSDAPAGAGPAAAHRTAAVTTAAGSPAPGPQAAAAGPPAQDFRGATFSGNAVFGNVSGDLVTHHHAPPPKDHWAEGQALFHQRCYPEAATEFRECLRHDQGNPEVHYYLALTLLSGRPPRDHADVTPVVNHLKLAAALVEARLLWLVVDEDHRPGRRRDAGPTPMMVALAAQVTPERAAEITNQFTASNSPTWRALRRRAESR